MSSQLQNCVDCGKALSRTATTCGNCSSTDPFGKNGAAIAFTSGLQGCLLRLLLLLADYGTWGFLTYRDYYSDNDFSNDISVLKSAHNE